MSFFFLIKPLVVWGPPIGAPLFVTIPFIFGDPFRIQTTGPQITHLPWAENCRCERGEKKIHSHPHSELHVSEIQNGLILVRKNRPLNWRAFAYFWRGPHFLLGSKYPSGICVVPKMIFCEETLRTETKCKMIQILVGNSIFLVCYMIAHVSTSSFSFHKWKIFILGINHERC